MHDLEDVARSSLAPLLRTRLRAAARRSSTSPRLTSSIATPLRLVRAPGPSSPQDAAARRGAAAWRAAPRRRRTETGSQSAAAARPESSGVVWSGCSMSCRLVHVGDRGSTWTGRLVGRVGQVGRSNEESSTPPGPPARLPHRRGCRYAATSTLICRGLASSRSGSRTVSTPFLYSAATLLGVDGLRQRERPAERAVAPLDVVELLFLHVVRRTSSRP